MNGLDIMFHKKGIVVYKILKYTKPLEAAGLKYTPIPTMDLTPLMRLLNCT
jgi:hypothetical protein